MRHESTGFVIAAAFSASVIGWILLTQRRADPVTPLATAAAPRRNANVSDPPPPIDEARVGALRTGAERDAEDVASRVALGNAYFGAERFDEAIVWYEQAFALNPSDVNVSTDLGVSYYYTRQPDRALEQFDRSLAVDPRHSKTILNVGIVRAYAKQDLDGAETAWEQAIEIAPDSPEARAAQEALETIRAAPPDRGD